MEIRRSLITVSFYFIAISLGATLSFGTDLTQEQAFYCPGYANCTGMDCLYNRMGPINDSKSFNKGEKVGMSCDSLEVEFNFPDSDDKSFVGKASWTCFRFYDAVGHHLALLKITINKPSDVNESQVQCKASIGNCAFLNETNSGMIFIAGLPDNCVTWTDELELLSPSNTETFECLNYANCIGDHCHFHRTSSETTSKAFLKNDDTIVRCNALKVDILYPSTNVSTFNGMESFTCFQYANENGTSFSVVEISLNKPEDVNGNQLTCSVEPYSDSCKQLKETSSQLIFVAGLPNTCFPWTLPTPVPGQDQTVDCPQYLENCTDNICHFKGTYVEKTSTPYVASDGTRFSCGSLKVDIKLPVTKDSVYIGNKTYSCFQYHNGDGTAFYVAEVNLTKPVDVHGSDVNCAFDGKKCRLQNETASQLTLVAGFPSSCVPWVPPTPETTTAPPTTETVSNTTAGPSTPGQTMDSTTKAGDITTGKSTYSTAQAGDISTGSSPDSTTQAGTMTTGKTPDSTIHASGVTTSSPETTTQGSSVARLEFAAVVVMGASLFIRQYL